MKKNLLFYILALLAGAILPLAFAPFGFYPFAILAPALLLFTWLRLAKPRQAFFSGWLFGLGFFGVGVSWIYISIHDFGHMPVLLALAITMLFVMVLALVPALQGYLMNKFCPRNTLAKNLLVFPAVWVLLEWVRTWFLTGFPWLFLGYSQFDTPLKNLAPIFGVYGVSFAVVLTSAVIVSIFQTKKNLTRILLLTGIVLFWLSSATLQFVQWTKPVGAKFQVSLVQGNVPLQSKWDAKQIPIILRNYQQIISKHLPSKLIVLPEAALPLTQWQIPNYLANLNNIARVWQNTIITGIIYQAKNNAYFNAMLSLGARQSLYLKKHLVPFGEYLPLESFTSRLLNFLHIPWPNFSDDPVATPPANHNNKNVQNNARKPFVRSFTLKGKNASTEVAPGPAKQAPFIAHNIRIAPLICYEIAYPNLVLSYLPEAQLLLNISEDSWFGHSIAASQQFEIARMRSLETGRYQLVVANSGITAIISPTGKIIAKAPSFEKTVLTGEAQAMIGATPWVSYGYLLWLVLVLTCLVVGLILANLKNSSFTPRKLPKYLQ